MPLDETGLSSMSSIFNSDDNFVDENFQKELERIMVDGTVPWFYVPNTVPSHREYDGFDGFSFFTHMYYINNQKNSDFFDIVFSIFEKFIEKHNIEVKEILHCRSNFMIKSDLPKITNPHVDFDFPHKVFLYYVNDSDGDTVFFKNDIKNNLKEVERVSPKGGRGILFNGLTLHGIEAPVESNYRIVVNIPFI
jgi:hypothetical protein